MARCVGVPVLDRSGSMAFVMTEAKQRGCGARSGELQLNAEADGRIGDIRDKHVGPKYHVSVPFVAEPWSVFGWPERQLGIAVPQSVSHSGDTTPVQSVREG